MPITKHQIPGWDVEQIERFYVYTSQEHPGLCVRQNCVSGTAEVLKSAAKDVLADPHQRAIYVESGRIGSDGREALALALMCVEICANPIARSLIEIDLA